VKINDNQARNEKTLMEVEGSASIGERREKKLNFKN